MSLMAGVVPASGSVLLPTDARARLTRTGVPDRLGVCVVVSPECGSMNIEFTDAERELLRQVAEEKAEYCRRCFERCRAPGRPESVRAGAAEWHRQAALWEAIAAKVR